MPTLNMQNGSTSLKMQVYSDKQIHVNVDTIVSFVIHSRQVLEGGALSMSHHVNYH